MALLIWQGLAAYEVSGDIVRMESPSVKVVDLETGLDASLFSESTGTTALTNPFTAEQNGHIEFYVAAGRYSIEVTKNTDSVTWSDVLIGYSVINDDTTNTTQYVSMVRDVTGYSDNYVSSTQLTFNPSTGKLDTGSIELTGYLRGPANFVIDPAAFGDNTGKLVIAGNLQVDGTTTTLNSTTLEVTDKNIIVAGGAPDAISADGAGVTADGANASLLYAAADDTWNLNKSLVTPGLTVNGTTGIKDVKETVVTDSSTTGTLTVNVGNQGVIYLTANQMANRTVNLVGDATTALDTYLTIGQSATTVVMATQGTTAYYFDVFQVDGVAVTPKWQGGYAPSSGSASSIDSYSFTVIKTGAGTFTVLAAQVQFA